MSALALLLDQAQRLGLALAIGFLVGVERGWKQRDEGEGERAAGLRTFALSGLLGGVTALLAPLGGGGVAIALTLSFCLAFMAFQLREASVESDNSATSAIAGLVVFGLGAYAVAGDPLLAASAGVAATTILAFKQSLHAWLRAITWSEARSALLILVATFIVLPFLPEGAVDAWGLIDLRALWMMTIAIATASFGGYIALRVLGDRMGVAVGALVGGLVSSTAVTLDLARRVQAGEVTATTAGAGASLAACVSVGRVVVISALMSFDLFARLWPSLLAAAVTLIVGAGLLALSRSVSKSHSTFASVRNPLDLISVARFAGVLGLLTVLANIASRTLGQRGLDAFAASAGLVDVDAVTLAIGRLVTDGLPTAHAVEAIGLALICNQLFKLAAIAISGSVAFAWRFGSVVLAAAGAASITFILVAGA
ncbi:MAG: MgtC/SapB family protein [Hyphomonadaceae bacterium]|nr:MgtC/SapB family protein [Hyphomonadaceae bacterium]